MFLCSSLFLLRTRVLHGQEHELVGEIDGILLLHHRGRVRSAACEVRLLPLSKRDSSSVAFGSEPKPDLLQVSNHKVSSTLRPVLIDSILCVMLICLWIRFTICRGGAKSILGALIIIFWIEDYVEMLLANGVEVEAAELAQEGEHGDEAAHCSSSSWFGMEPNKHFD